MLLIWFHVKKIKSKILSSSSRLLWSYVSVGSRQVRLGEYDVSTTAEPLPHEEFDISDIQVTSSSKTSSSLSPCPQRWHHRQRFFSLADHIFLTPLQQYHQTKHHLSPFGLRQVFLALPCRSTRTSTTPPWSTTSPSWGWWGAPGGSRTSTWWAEWSWRGNTCLQNFFKVCVGDLLPEGLTDCVVTGWGRRSEGDLSSSSSSSPSSSSSSPSPSTWPRSDCNGPYWT